MVREGIRERKKISIATYNWGESSPVTNVHECSGSNQVFTNLLIAPKAGVMEGRHSMLVL
jgi:hypothetical protein